MLAATNGRLVEAQRPIKSNFRERGFTTFIAAGVPIDVFERAFASIEQRVLNEIRTVSKGRCGPQQKADVANLFAVHLVRSPSFKTFHEHITLNFRGDAMAFAEEPELAERFQRQHGRPPLPGELEDLTFAAYDELVSDPLHLAETMVRQHDQIAAKLNEFFIQVVEIDASLPGLALSDTPVVHAAIATERYGFRDQLAVLDADLIIGPLTRRTLACFTATRVPNTTITVRRRLDVINAVFVRAARSEVACHPEDARAIQQAISKLDRLPAHLIFGGK